MEEYLKLFEEAISKQVALLGKKEAYAAAKEAGLGVDSEGRVVTCAGNPVVVLLRLIRVFTENGNFAALEQCKELIDKVTEAAEELDIEFPLKPIELS